MPTWQSGDIASNGITVHYTRTGANPSEAKPPLVLAHGFSDDGLCWTPVVTALAGQFDIIMVDARGHGGSSAPEEGYGSAEQAADLAGVIAGLGLQRPAVLGHSMGAATALALAGTYPELPGAILLEDPPAVWAMPPGGNRMDDPELQARRRAELMSNKQKTREELITAQHAATPGWSEAELGPWADSKLRLSPNIVNRAGSQPVDWPSILPRISCPALLITADPAHGAIVTAETADSLNALIPGLRIAHIAGAGHSIRREQFDRYLQVVQAFLLEWQSMRS